MPRARLHHDQLEIDAELVRRLLRAQLPHLADRPLREIDAGGTENAVFRLGPDLTVRLPLRHGAVSGLEKELRWLPLMNEHLTLEIPQAIARGEPTAEYPNPWAVMTWIDGADALTTPITDQNDAARTLARFVTELRRIPDPPDRATEPGFGRGGPLADRDDAFREALAQCHELTNKDQITDVWDDARAAEPYAGPPVWLHADLIPGNLLCDVDGRVKAVLDFGTLSSGDPAYDVTPAWHVLDGPSRQEFRNLVNADDATWRRARGLVLSGAVIAFPYYRDTNPAMMATARRGITETLSG